MTYRRTPTKTGRRRIARVGALALIGALLLAACTEKVKPPTTEPAEALGGRADDVRPADADPVTDADAGSR